MKRYFYDCELIESNKSQFNIKKLTYLMIVFVEQSNLLKFSDYFNILKKKF